MNKKLIPLIILILTLFTNNSFAHKSPNPINISCGLTNIISMAGPKIQYVTYAISHTLLKQHFKLENGEKTGGGGFKTELPVEVKIKTTSGTITKAGNILVNYYENGALEVGQFSPMNGHLVPNSVFQQYPDDVSHKESMKNEIISCKIIP